MDTTEKLTVFKQRTPTESPVEPKIEPTATETPNRVSEPPPGAQPLQDALPEELEIWETESKKKYVNEYFNTHNIGHEFQYKMPLAKIDKFIKGELTERNYAKTTENYQKILQEIETQIGSSSLELSRRLQKIAGFLGILQRQNKLRELKKKYAEPNKSSEESLWS